MEPPKFEYSRVEDFKANEVTLYQKRPEEVAENPTFKQHCSFDDDGEILSGEKTTKVRALICSCFQRGYLSGTLRRMTRQEQGTVDPYPMPQPLTESGYLRPRPRNEFLNTPEEVCVELKSLVFPGVGPEKGLIVVAGSTNSGKSTYVRGLIHHYLVNRVADWIQSNGTLRRPHFVTVEEPIEEDFQAAPNFTGYSCGSVDYTPRQIGEDVLDLADAIEDAKRQTPEILYVGEVRNRRNWRDIVEFAGSGHLVITTTHAGSLQETMGRIFEANNARTKAQRSYIAKRIVAIIHLRYMPVSISGTNVTKAIIPSMWRRTDQGEMDIMGTGLSSIVPRHISDLVSAKTESCVGRAWFARQLVERHERAVSQNLGKLMAIIEEALAWDLQGV